MFKLCNKMTISSYTIDNINETLNMCEHCKYYYNCNVALELNDKLKQLENLQNLHIKNFKRWIYKNKVFSIHIDSAYFIDVFYMGKGNIKMSKVIINNNGKTSFIEHNFKIADIIKTNFSFTTK